VQQKLAYAGHVLRGSSGRNALVILEGNIRGKRAKGRPTIHETLGKVKFCYFFDFKLTHIHKFYEIGVPICN